MNQQRQAWLRSILIFSIIITSIHYTDNALFINNYPQPEWITTSGIYIIWLVMSAIAIASYWLYNKQNLWLSYCCLIIYSVTGLSSPAHYFYGAMSAFSVKMHTFIWCDFIAGLSVLGFVIWSGAIAKEWQSEKTSY